MKVRDELAAVNRKSDIATCAVFCAIGLLFAAAAYSIAALKGMTEASAGGIIPLVMLAVIFFGLGVFMVITERRPYGLDGETKLFYIWEK